MIFCVEVIGWIVLLTLSGIIVYNLAHFFYSIYLGAKLGRNINPRKYGPWAGESSHFEMFSLATLFENIETNYGYSRDWIH